ncbi:MAG: PKD domain-containing protein [Thermoanaerobaculia bacterium]
MRNLRSITRRSLLLLAALVVPVGCSEGTPVAPTGAILRVSAYPTRIGTRGVSTVTVNAYRSTGNPVNPGTEIRLSSTIGTIDPVAYTTESGQATALLRGDGRVGTATVTAFSGGLEPVTLDISVGQLSASMSFQVTPSSVAETGGTLDLLALVRDDVSQPLAGAQVNFRSEVGELDSGGRFITTDENGEARDRLRVTAADLQLVSDDNFQVTAEVGGAGGTIISRTFQVGIQRPPQAAFTFQRAGLVVTFNDTSTGSPTSWIWDFGDDTPTSSQQNPVHAYSEAGTYVVTLTARNSIGTSSASNLVQITN